MMDEIHYSKRAIFMEIKKIQRKDMGYDSEIFRLRLQILNLQSRIDSFEDPESPHNKFIQAEIDRIRARIDHMQENAYDIERKELSKSLENSAASNPVCLGLGIDAKKHRAIYAFIASLYDGKLHLALWPENLHGTSGLACMIDALFGDIAPIIGADRNRWKKAAKYFTNHDGKPFKSDTLKKVASSFRNEVRTPPTEAVNLIDTWRQQMVNNTST